MYNKIFYSLLLTASLLYAKDDFSSERILGIEVGYASTTSNASGVQTTTRDVESGFRLGAQNEEWRTTLSASFLATNGRDYQKVMVSFDRFIWTDLYKTDNIIFKPYVGAHLGWLRYTEDVSLNENSMAYGGQAGLALNVLNKVDFDFSYRYSTVDMESVDEIGSFVFGVNFIY